MSEGPRPSAGLSLTAQHLLCHQPKMMTWMMWVTLMKWMTWVTLMTSMMWVTLMISILKVHLVLLVVLVEAELWATISIGEMEILTIGEMKMPIPILQIGITQLVARSCYLLIGTQALLQYDFH